jgi:hypothetical protein
MVLLMFQVLWVLVAAATAIEVALVLTRLCQRWGASRRAAKNRPLDSGQ